ncbi:MAG: DUF5615 family PIN-like protein [Gemmataceae bacterium]|nr:DUF5615 family PIN-like protein [Gemmataceae bacterium]
MKILADENVAKGVVRWLRDQGHDVLHAVEVQRGADDESWAHRADLEDRLLITCDKDFGELVFRHDLAKYGVLLLRLPDCRTPPVRAKLEEIWSIVEANIPGHFIVATVSKVRVRKLSDN